MGEPEDGDSSGQGLRGGYGQEECHKMNAEEEEEEEDDDPLPVVTHECSVSEEKLQNVVPKKNDGIEQQADSNGYSDDETPSQQEQMECDEQADESEENNEGPVLPRVENFTIRVPNYSSRGGASRVDKNGKEPTAPSSLTLEQEPVVIGMGSSDDSESEQSVTSSKPPVLSPWALIQHCLFCNRSFHQNQEFREHISECNPAVAKIVNLERKTCLVCSRRIPSFAITGLVRHSIVCVITEYEKIQKAKEKQWRVKEEKPSPPPDSEEEGEGTVQKNGSQNCRTADVRRRVVKSPLAPPASSKFTDDQKDTLMNVYKRKKRPGKKEMESLAETTGLTFAQINSWFYRTNHMDSKGTLGLVGLSVVERVKIKQEAESVSWRTPTVEAGRKSKYPPHMVKTLQDSFKNNKYPSPQEKAELSKKTSLSATQIQNWFCNNRKNLKQVNSPRVSLATGAETCTRRTSDSRARVQTDSRSRSPEGQHVSSSEAETFEDLPKSSQDVLIESFKKNPRPTAIEFIRLTNLTGLLAETLQDWFKRHKPSRSTSRSRSYEDVKDEVPRRDVDLPKDVTTMTWRQKLIALKRLTGQDILDVLNDWKPVIMKTLQLYFTAETNARHTLDDESINLSECLEALSPYTLSQLTSFSNWEEDFVVSMYPEQPGKIWTQVVNSFREKILKIWTRIIVFSNFANLPVTEAAKEVYRIYLRRDLRQLEGAWLIADLFEQLRTSAAQEINEYEVDSDISLNSS